MGEGTASRLIEAAVSAARALGLNEVRVRWKLVRLEQSWRQALHRAAEKRAHVGYAHKVCPACGRIQDRDARACSGCASPLASRSTAVVARVLGLAGAGVSPSALLTVAILTVYGRVAAAAASVVDFDSLTLLHFGAHFPPAVWAGEWWRLATAVFLHAGVMHLGFNLVALQQIGPQIEEVFGRRAMLFLFMATGILGNLGSELLGLRGVAIGASGAVMGLIGAAAAWGHRGGTAHGRMVRDQMLKWAAYTMVFGLFVHADNGAHAAGFVSGAVLGVVLPPAAAGRSSSPAALGWVLGAVGAGLAILAFALCLFPPASGIEALIRGGG